MSDDDAIRRGHRAQAELNETWQAFENLRAGLVKEWSESPEAESAYRERLFLAVRTLDHVRGALSKHIDSGLIAQKLIEKLRPQAA